MDTHVALWLPLALVLIELIEVTGGVVEENALRSEAAEDFGSLEVRDCLEKTAFFTAVDNLDRLLTDRTEVHQELHAEPACE